MYKKMIFGGVICLLAGIAFGAPAANKMVASKAEETKKPESEQVVMSNLPDKIKLIIGIGETKNYYIRIRAIHSLGKYLPPDQVEALYKFLYTRLENQKLKDLQFNALKNEIVLELMHQKNSPKDLAGHLVKMYQDKTFDPTWRDYCVQFFGKWYADAPHNEGRKAMLENLYAAANEVEGSIGGTAVTMLRHMVHLPEVDRKKVADLAYQVLTNPKCSVTGQTSALQVCAELGNKQALPIARKIAVSKKNKILRMSAIAAVGMLGDASDIPWLTKLSKSTDLV